MIRLDIRQVAVHLEEYLEQVENGGTLTICRNGKRVASVRPIKRKAKVKRVFGLNDGFGVASVL